MKTIIILLSLVISISLSLAQTYEDSRTYFEKNDNELNEIYQKLIDTNRSDTLFINNLKTSQRAWLTFRDAQLTLIYPDHVSIEKRYSLSKNELKYLSYLTEDRTRVLIDLLNTSTIKTVYVSDLEIIRSGYIHSGIGLDKPYWSDKLVICGKRYSKGIVMHPESGRLVAYAEFLINKKEGRLLGVAGYCEGDSYINYYGKMRYRIFVDGELIYGNELIGKECRGIDLNLGSGKILRIESDDGGDNNYSDHMSFGDLRIIY